MLTPIELSLTPRALDPQRDRAKGQCNFNVTLAPEVTECLLTRIPALFHCGVDEVLLTALSLAVAKWRNRPDVTSVMVDLEGHGPRQHVFGRRSIANCRLVHQSVSRPVGTGSIDFESALSGGIALDHALKRIKEQFRTIPEHGPGYGMLRYLIPKPRRIPCEFGAATNRVSTISDALEIRLRKIGVLRQNATH